MNVTRREILLKLDLVVDKLMNLDRPDNEEKLTKEGGESIGMFPRDFGIEEWDWPQGVGLYGLSKLNKYMDNKYMNFLNSWYEGNLKKDLPAKNINTTAPLLTLVELCDEFNNKEYENLCLEWAHWLMECLPRTKEGGFQHIITANGDIKGVRLNESEIWIDTIFMTVLFLNKMGHKYKKQEWIDESINQVLIHIKYLYEKKNGLLYHGWSFNQNDNFGGIFWCRGNSWFTFGILEFIDTFKGTLNPGIKKFLIDTFKAQVKALKKYQSDCGLWHTIIDDPTSYKEVSGTAAIAKGMLKGLRMGILDDSYKNCAEKAIDAICENINDQGTVLNVSGGTGVGRSKDYYKNIVIAPMAYGQSLAIVALSEVLEYLDN